MKTGYLRQDDSSHWYLVPIELATEFDMASDEILSQEYHTDEWYESVDTFKDKFGKYRIGGGIEHLEIIIPE